MKNRLLLLGLTGALVALIAVSFAPAKTPRPLKFSAALNIGQEKPHPKGAKAGASGRFTATLSGTTLTWKLSFTHLSLVMSAATDPRLYLRRGEATH